MVLAASLPLGKKYGFFHGLPMSNLANLSSNKKRERISTSSQESVTSPEQKKTKIPQRKRMR